MTPRVVLNIFMSFILPHFLYSAPSIFLVKKGDILEKMFEKAIKKIFISKKHYWIKGIRDSIGMNKLEVWAD